MGCYVNPKGMSKEEWLARNGTAVQKQFVDDGDNLTVCLVQNSQFSAAGVCFDRREFEGFSYPDGRPRRWYVVPVSKLKEVSDIESYLE